MKKNIIGILALCIPSFAMAAPLTTTLTCDQAKAIVVQQGGVVLYSSPNVFDRYVSSGAFCAVREITQQAFVPTHDKPLCPIGNTCIQPDGTNGYL